MHGQGTVQEMYINSQTQNGNVPSQYTTGLPSWVGRECESLSMLDLINTVYERETLHFILFRP
jgi:hypothetical protein